MNRSAAVVLACAALGLPTLLALPWADAAYLAGLALIVACMVGGWWTAPRGRRSGWGWVAVTGVAWLTGDALARWGNVEYLPDVAWVASYLTLGAGLLTMLRRRGLPASTRREVVLDAVVVSAAGAALLWHLVARPGITGDVTAADAAFALAYPAGDLVLLGLTAALLLSPGRLGPAGHLLSVAIGATVACDVAFSVMPRFFSDDVVSRLDGVLVLVNGLIAAAAIHPDRTALSRRPRADEGLAMGRMRVLFLGAGLCLVLAFATLSNGENRVDQLVAVGLGVAVAGALIIRFFLLVDERDRARLALHHAAHHDPLTGLANRLLLGRRLAQAAAEGSPMSLAFLDLDGFKPVNDAHGHAAGDHVLREVASRLAALAGDDDTVARVGGDEFVVLHIGNADVRESIAAALEAAVLLPQGIPVRIRGSVGLARVAAGEAPDDADALLALADRAMYDAKRLAREPGTPAT